MSPNERTTCPNCGAIFRRGRPACPECGSDERTGWQDGDELDYQAVEIPDFYDDDATAERRPAKWWLLALILALVAAFAIALVR